MEARVTHLLAFYLAVKGVEILQIGLASNWADRKPLIILGFVTIIACMIAAEAFVNMQGDQAESVGVTFLPPSYRGY